MEALQKDAAMFLSHFQLKFHWTEILAKAIISHMRHFEGYFSH